MGQRTNTATWLPNQQRWQINVQKNGVRRSFTSSKPGRTGQREANAKADAWLDDGISNTRMLVEAAYPQWIGELKLTTSRSNWEPIQSRWNVWVRPVIGRRRVGDLTEQQLQAIINKGFAGGLSKKYLSNMCTDLTMFCKWLRLSKMSTLRPEELHVPKGARSKEKEILQPEDLRTLMDLYNRGGFTGGYYHQHNGPKMMSMERPNHFGTEAARLILQKKGGVQAQALEYLYPGGRAGEP